LNKIQIAATLISFGLYSSSYNIIFKLSIIFRLHLELGDFVELISEY